MRAYGRLAGQESPCSPTCQVFNDLPRRDCKLISGALTRSALTEIPSPPVSPRICSAESRRLARSSKQVVALLRSCCLAQRSPGFANPGSRYASGRVLFRSSFLCAHQDDDVPEKFTSSRVPPASQCSRYQFLFRFIVKPKVSSMLFHHFDFRSRKN